MMYQIKLLYLIIIYKAGRTPLFLALKLNNKNITIALLYYGANVINKLMKATNKLKHLNDFTYTLKF